MIAFFQHVYPVLDFRERSERQRERVRTALRESGCAYSVVSCQCGSENETLGRLQWDARHGGAQYYVYLHLKGLTHPGDVHVDDWRELLEYFNIDCWRQMRAELERGADVVGANLEAEPFLHYAGNFFWITRSALCKLSPLKRGENPEAWVGTMPEALCLKSLHDSNVNHYHERYPPERYR